MHAQPHQDAPSASLQQPHKAADFVLLGMRLGGFYRMKPPKM